MGRIVSMAEATLPSYSDNGSGFPVFRGPYFKRTRGWRRLPSRRCQGERQVFFYDAKHSWQTWFLSARKGMAVQVRNSL